MKDKEQAVEEYVKSLQSENESLKRQLEEAENLIRFYANKDNWYPFRSFADEWCAIDTSDWNYMYDTQAKHLGGKRARDYFKSKEAKGEG